jgi:hypothetical protein
VSENKRIPILSESEIKELRQILTHARQTHLTSISYDEKLNNLRSKVHQTLKELVDRYTSLGKYWDAEYIGAAQIRFFDDGRSLGFGTSAIGRAGELEYFYETFREWGFESIREFYDLPKERRHMFCDNAQSVVEALAGPKIQGIRDLQSDVEQEADYKPLQQLYCKALEARYIVKNEWGELARKTIRDS